MSTNTGMSSCCLSGSVHEGTPTGREDNIGGLDVYVAEPSSKSTSKSIVFITDIFGWKFKNVRLLADNYAKAGFYCYIPDVHQGDSLPATNEKIKDLLDKKQVPTQVEYYEDQMHWFTLRGDWSFDKDKKAMDDAEKQGIKWFEKYLL